MGKSVRVNLSVPQQVDAVLVAYSELTGRTKAAVVMEAVGLQLSNWNRVVWQARGELPVVNVGLPKAGE